MATGWAVRFRGKLAHKGIVSASNFVNLAIQRYLVLDFEHAPSDLYGVEPSFGNDMVFGGETFGHIDGLWVGNGTIELGASGTNLHLPHHDEDDPDYDPGFRRIDAIVAALSEVTVGEVGEVHGVVGFEHHDMPNGWPIIRCDDGLCRMGLTPCSDVIDWSFGQEKKRRVVVPSVLPIEFANARSLDGRELRIDLDALKVRLTAAA